MRSDFNLSANEQKLEQANRLAALANAKHERALTLANIIGRAAAQQNVWRTVESAEDYLGRLGIDLTKI